MINGDSNEINTLSTFKNENTKFFEFHTVNIRFVKSMCPAWDEMTSMTITSLLFGYFRESECTTFVVIFFLLLIKLPIR